MFFYSNSKKDCIDKVNFTLRMNIYLRTTIQTIWSRSMFGFFTVHH